MKKENILFVLCGILAGFIGGFFFANHYNRNAITANAATQTADQQMPAPFANAPNQSSAPNIQPSQNMSAPMPFVQEAIDKAKTEPQNFEAQTAAGDLFYKIQRFQDAVPYYQKALELKADNLDIMTKLGNCYFDVSNFYQAQKYYAQILEKTPDNISVRTDYGLSFYLQNPPNIERALQEYQKSLKINPNHEITLQNLAIAQSSSGDTNGLRQTVAALEKVNANNPLIKELRTRNSL